MPACACSGRTSQQPLRPTATCLLYVVVLLMQASPQSMSAQTGRGLDGDRSVDERASGLGAGAGEYLSGTDGSGIHVNEKLLDRKEADVLSSAFLMALVTPRLEDYVNFGFMIGTGMTIQHPLDRWGPDEADCSMRLRVKIPAMGELDSNPTMLRVQGVIVGTEIQTLLLNELWLLEASGEVAYDEEVEVELPTLWLYTKKLMQGLLSSGQANLDHWRMEVFPHTCDAALYLNFKGMNLFECMELCILHENCTSVGYTGVDWDGPAGCALYANTVCHARPSSMWFRFRPSPPLWISVSVQQGERAVASSNFELLRFGSSWFSLELPLACTAPLARPIFYNDLDCLFRHDLAPSVIRWSVEDSGSSGNNEQLSAVWLSVRSVLHMLPTKNLRATAEVCSVKTGCEDVGTLSDGWISREVVCGSNSTLHIKGSSGPADFSATMRLNLSLSAVTGAALNRHDNTSSDQLEHPKTLGGGDESSEEKVPLFEDAPYISVILASRFDGVSSDSLRRLRLAVEAWLELAARMCLPLEVIVVETISEGQSMFLSDVFGTAYPHVAQANIRPCDLVNRNMLRIIRMLELPIQSIDYFSQKGNTLFRSRLGVEQYTAKNAGARRARGDFILFTNQDVLPSTQLVHSLALRTLSEDSFFRVWLDNLPGPVENERGGIIGTLEALAKNFEEESIWIGDETSTFRRGSNHGRWHRNTCSNGGSNVSHIKGHSQNGHLATMNAGDFTLVARRHVWRLRGYHEVGSPTGQQDSFFLCKLRGLGLYQLSFQAPCLAFHQAHKKSSWAGGALDLLLPEQWPRWSDQNYNLSAWKEHCSRLVEKPRMWSKVDWGLRGQSLHENTFFHTLQSGLAPEFSTMQKWLRVVDGPAETAEYRPWHSSPGFERLQEQAIEIVFLSYSWAEKVLELDKLSTMDMTLYVSKRSSYHFQFALCALSDGCNVLYPLGDWRMSAEALGISEASVDACSMRLTLPASKVSEVIGTILYSAANSVLAQGQGGVMGKRFVEHELGFTILFYERINGKNTVVGSREVSLHVSVPSVLVSPMFGSKNARVPLGGHFPLKLIRWDRSKNSMLISGSMTSSLESWRLSLSKLSPLKIVTEISVSINNHLVRKQAPWDYYADESVKGAMHVRVRGKSRFGGDAQLASGWLGHLGHLRHEVLDCHQTAVSKRFPAGRGIESFFKGRCIFEVFADCRGPTVGAIGGEATDMVLDLVIFVEGEDPIVLTSDAPLDEATKSALQQCKWAPSGPATRNELDPASRLFDPSLQRWEHVIGEEESNMSLALCVSGAVSDDFTEDLRRVLSSVVLSVPSSRNVAVFVHGWCEEGVACGKKELSAMEKTLQGVVEDGGAWLAQVALGEFPHISSNSTAGGRSFSSHADWAVITSGVHWFSHMIRTVDPSKFPAFSFGRVLWVPLSRSYSVADAVFPSLSSRWESVMSGQGVDVTSIPSGEFILPAVLMRRTESQRVLYRIWNSVTWQKDILGVMNNLVDPTQNLQTVPLLGSKMPLQSKQAQTKGRGIALLVVGQLRVSWPTVASSFRKFIVEPLHDNGRERVHVFFVVSPFDGSHPVDVSILRQNLPSHIGVTVHVSASPSLRPLPQCGEDSLPSLPGSIRDVAQAADITAAWRLVADAEAREGMEFEFVMRVRPDSLFEAPFPPLPTWRLVVQDRRVYTLRVFAPTNRTQTASYIFGDQVLVMSRSTASTFLPNVLAGVWRCFHRSVLAGVDPENEEFALNVDCAGQLAVCREGPRHPSCRGLQCMEHHGLNFEVNMRYVLAERGIAIRRLPFPLFPAHASTLYPPGFVSHSHQWDCYCRVPCSALPCEKCASTDFWCSSG